MPIIDKKQLWFNYFLILSIVSLVFGTEMSSGDQLKAVNFEVFGRVQGVFFRKYTQREATKLGLVGWCMNTDHGTVTGVMEGQPNKISNMKSWLEKTGSPASRIDKAAFTNEHDIPALSFTSFEIKR